MQKSYYFCIHIIIMPTTMKRKRYQLLAPLLIKNLQKRHYDAYYCPTAADIRDKVKALMPEGSSVSWGGSETIRKSGVTAMLKQGGYVVYDRDEATNEQEKLAIYRKAFECDYYLTSVNAMSQDGVIINIDGNGNRVAAITWGPTHVILIVSMNKVCPDVDTAIKRARCVAAPTNMMRFDTLRTPCKTDGACHDCLSPDSICNYICLQRMSHPAHRHIVLLTDEDLGY